jgi:hypothetical protein
MGREIRRVCPNWEHPRYSEDTATDSRRIGEYVPMFDESYIHAMNVWIDGFRKWEAGDHPDRKDSGCRHFAEWNGEAPSDPDMYRPDWSDIPADQLWFQVYQTPFATREELVAHLVNVGDEWDGKWSRRSAEAFVFGEGYAPSLMIVQGAQGAQVITSKDIPGHFTQA